MMKKQAIKDAIKCKFKDCIDCKNFTGAIDVPGCIERLAKELLIVKKELKASRNGVVCTGTMEQKISRNCADCRLYEQPMNDRPCKSCLQTDGIFFEPIQED